MGKKIVFGIGILLLLIICFICLYLTDKANEENRTVETAEQFLDALVVCDINKAKGLSAGSVLANLSNNKGKGNLSEHKVISKTVYVISENKKWAELNAELETKDQKTSAVDVHWYKIHLVNNDENNWRVYRIKEIEALPGKEQRLNNLDLEEATKVFSQYLALLSQNKYDKAGELLIGKAKTVHEQTKLILGTAPVIKYYKNIELDLLYYDGKLLITEVQYRVDGRNTSTVVSFSRTSEGWRIYNVSQI